jgi:hypothetical protein
MIGHSQLIQLTVIVMNFLHEVQLSFVNVEVK